jgi:hypothetical protein
MRNRYTIAPKTRTPASDRYPLPVTFNLKNAEINMDERVHHPMKKFRRTNSFGGLNRISRLSPGINSAPQRFYRSVTLFDIFFCQTDRRRFMRSSAIKNDLLILWQVRQFGFEFAKEDCTFQKNLPASVVIVGTDQERIAGFK